MSKTFNTPEEVAAMLPKEIAAAYLLNYDHDYAQGSDALPTQYIHNAIKWSFDWNLTPQGEMYWDLPIWRLRRFGLRNWQLPKVYNPPSKP